ncbi:MAG: P-loop NTPase [Proteobacteria bacterium]|nr:P-loop NTPase [Pseudomonadota bacterium]
MKLAVSGKGGVGKSTIAGALALVLAEKGKRVVALDADPDANLATALGFSDHLRDKIVPISNQIKLIEERTGAKVKQYGQMFKLNPDVSDVAEKLAVTGNGVSLLELGAVEMGGSGCACPENVFIRSLVTDLVLYKGDILIMDMEAGVEHLGRATAKGVNAMLIVVEPGKRSIECAERVMAMSKEIGINKVEVVFNKVTNNDDQCYLESALPGIKPLSIIPYSDDIRRADQSDDLITETIGKDLNKRLQLLAETLIEKYSQ